MLVFLAIIMCKLWARAIMLSNFLIMLSRWKIYSDLLKNFSVSVGFAFESSS